MEKLGRKSSVGGHMQRSYGISLLAGTLLSSALVAGCASYASRVQQAAVPVDDGIVYYMPSRPIKVVVTVDAQGVQTPSIGTIEASPDLRQRFVLHYEQNLVGKNHMSIGVNAHGLLTSANADTTSGIPDIVRNIGKAIGSIQGVLLGARKHAQPQTAPPSCPAGTYTRLIYPEDPDILEPLCDFQITLRSAGSARATSLGRTDRAEDSVRVSEAHTSQSGIFYKHDLPYIVTMKSKDGLPSEFMAYSPNLAPIAFLPITRTLFSNNAVNITLTEGTVTAVDQTSDSELVALTGLPADFISSYTTALGQILSAVGTNVQSQTTIINNKRDLAVATIKRQACATAIDANKAALDPSNIAGKTGQDLTDAMNKLNTVLTNIKTVCS